MIAIDLYLQCKILEMGRDIIYNDNAIVYFKPANNIHDLASQVMRAVNGHKQIEDYVSLFSIGLPDSDCQCGKECCQIRLAQCQLQ